MKRWIQGLVLLTLFIYCIWVFLDLLLKNKGTLEALSNHSLTLFPALIASVLLLLASVLIRSHRWILMLNQPQAFWLGFRSIAIGYLVQCPLSKFGEFARLGNFNRSNSTPVATLLSTLFLDRFLDTITLMSMIIYCMFTSSVLLESHFPQFNQILPKFGILSLLALLGIILVIFKHKWVESLLQKQTWIGTIWKEKLASFFTKFTAGLGYCKGIKGLTYLLLSSIVIWILYYLAFLVVIKSYPNLPAQILFSDIWLLFCIGTLGSLIPVPGGVAYPLFIQKGIAVIWPEVSLQDGIVLSTIVYLYNYWAVNIILGGLSISYQLFKHQKIHGDD
jgi:hypothetical protein